ncbi:molybdopterin molybdochelatase [Rhizobium sp. RU20A]|uniref:molybdopterin molybdotransferase MoeA n=1 Tax=Rhizobium sp. RU20A TaxID=1907412 RepID=UPI000956C584|nr:gephyrin-like molybdotransferase Glp [Rhizobium sp. RU20A]SIQ03498.1 molybdopterin molybdochelatase [Rhizobium sp. RU20A]
MSLLPVEEALRRLLDAAVLPSGVETVELDQANGRVLAADLAARLTHPAFDNSAMDGYALRHDDLAAGAPLKIIGRSVAGQRFDGTVGPGETVRIFTGAPMPAGADTVLLQEDAERLDEMHVRPTFLPERGRHIRPKGQDFRQGEIILSAGAVLDPGRLTLAASCNHASLPVFRRPLVAILATGDELVAPGSEPGADQIVASNGAGVSAIARENGADIIDLGIVADRKEAIAAAVTRAREAGADILVTLGGASVGDHDLVQPTLVSLGMQLDFWKIAMRPGKPLMVGHLGAMQVLGLPGNPVSSLVCGLLFLEPLVRRLARLPARDRTMAVRLAAPLPANEKRQDYVRARFVDGEDPPSALPFSRQDSSMVTVFAGSDCLIVRPPQAEPAAIGDRLPALRLR